MLCGPYSSAAACTSATRARLLAAYAPRLPCVAIAFEEEVTETLKQVIEAAVRGQRIFQPGPTIPAGTQPGNLTAMGLTSQEAAILRLVAGGYSNKEVARHLGISMGTVKNHISDILRKLDARDRTHAVLKALAGHLLSKEDSTSG